MINYSITLPEGNNRNIQLEKETAWLSEDMELALSAFDIDGKKGLSSDELSQAFDYFVNKEKEIAVVGKKGDSIITSKDIEQIVKTDSKFSAIKDYLKDDNKVVDLLSNIVMTLSALVKNNKDYYRARYIDSTGIVYEDPTGNIYVTDSRRAVKNTQSETKEVDGKKVQLCLNNKNETFVISADGKYIYTTPAYVAKCLGYKSSSSKLSDLSDYKYYNIEDRELGIQKELRKVKQFKVWNNKTYSFTNSKYNLVIEK